MFRAWQLMGFGTLPPKVSATWASSDEDPGAFTTYTFASLALGTARGYRLVAVHGTNNTAPRTISGVTVDGVAAIAVGSAVSNSNSTVAFWIAPASANTTGDVEVTWSAGQIVCGVGVWQVEGLVSLTPTATGSDTSMSSGELSAVVEVLGDGVIFGAAFNRANTAFTWSGLTEDYNIACDSNTKRMTGGSLSVSTTTTVTCAPTVGSGSGNEPCLVVVALR